MLRVSEPATGIDRELTTLARRASDDAGGVPVALLEGFLPALIGAAATGRRLDRDELDRFRRAGGEAAQAGTPLAGVVDLFLNAARLAWPRLPDLVRDVHGIRLPPDALVGVGSALLRTADDALAAIAAGYSEAGRRLARREESVRREFIDDLLGGHTDVGALVDRAERFGLRLAAAHLVAVVRAHRPLTPLGRTVEHVAERLRTRYHDRDVLVVTKGGLLVCVVPERGSAVRETRPSRAAQQHLGEELHRITRELAGGTHWQLGVGRPHAGPWGIFRSYGEALEALDFADRLDLPDPVVLADQLLVYRVFLRDQAAMIDLVRSVIGSLTEARGGAEPLLETLSAYFAAGGVAVEAARRLHLSVRAVTYRLERVKALTGYSPSDPTQRLPLEVAVIGAQLLGWPETPLPEE